MHAGQPHWCHWEMGSQSLQEAGEVGKLHPWKFFKTYLADCGSGQLGLTPRSALLGGGGWGRDSRGPSWLG